MVLRKIKQVAAGGILIVPLWSTQPWFPFAMSLIVSRSVLLKAKMDLFQFTRQQGHGTSTEQTSEPIGYFSFGSTLRGLSFQRTLVPSLIRHGESPQNVSTTSLCKNGCHIAQNDLFIPLLQL